MAVARMKKVTIVGHQSDKEKAVEILQRMGSLQILNLKDNAEALEAGSIGGAQPAPNPHNEQALAEVTFAINFLDRFQEKQKGLLESFIGSKVPVEAEALRKVLAQFNWHAVFERCSSIDSRLTEIRNLKSRLASQKETLAPWNDLDIPLEQIADTDSTEVFAATGAIVDVEALENAIVQARARVGVFTVARDAKQAYVVAFVLKGDREAQDVMRPYGLTRVAFGDMTGTARLNIARIESEMSTATAEEAAISAEVKELLKEYTSLLTLYDELTAVKSRGSVEQNFARTEQVFAIQGWVKTRQAQELKNTLDSATDSSLVITFEDPGADDTPPVSLENNKWIEPFEMVTTIYGYPSYNETDPTPLLAPFFFVYFGLALSDAAYGVLLALASIWAIKKLDMPWSQKKLFRLMVFCGISTVVFGAMLGSWFGNIYELPGFGFMKGFRDSLFVFDPIQDPLRMLIISLALGVVQIWFGIFVKMVATVKQSGLVTGLLDQGSWLFLLGALVFMVLAGAGVVAKELAPLASRLSQLGAVFVIAAQGRSARSWIAKPFLGLYGLYSIVAYFSDMLSYARLLALGLATGVIANVVNQMALLVKPIPFLGPVIMVVVLLGGHAFNLVINILGSFIHAGRLQFVEFFTKFFEGGGRAFRPFRKDNKYTAVRG